MKDLSNPGNLHQIMRRLAQLAPEKFATDDANLAVQINSPSECLGSFTCLTYSQNINWFALEGSILEWLRLDGAIVETEAIPGDGWWVKITATFNGKTPERIEVFNNENLTAALAIAYEEYLGLKKAAHEKLALWAKENAVSA